MGMDMFVMENIQLDTLLKVGEALENCIEALAVLKAPVSLCERVEAQEALQQLSEAFNLKEGVRFSTVEFERCPVCGEPEQEHWLIPVWKCPGE